VTAAGVAVATSANVGSDASYAESSEAMSVGTVGALGVGGSENDFTTPTWASLAYHRYLNKGYDNGVEWNRTYDSRRLVSFYVAEVEVLDKVCIFIS
jgi:hypothetical protein